MTTVYFIRGKKRGLQEAENIHAFGSWSEARHQLEKFQEMYGPKWTLWIGGVQVFRDELEQGASARDIH